MLEGVAHPSAPRTLIVEVDELVESIPAVAVWGPGPRGTRPLVYPHCHRFRYRQCRRCRGRATADCHYRL